MVSWLQLWYGYLDVLRLWEDSFFAEISMRPGWQGVVLMRFLGRGVLFVYPVNKEATISPKGRVL